MMMTVTGRGDAAEDDQVKRTEDPIGRSRLRGRRLWILIRCGVR